MPRPRQLPDRARVVIIGGGVGGAAVAYHLAQLGERDVILVDRNELTSGSTFHSAGLVGQLRGSVSLTRMMMDSVELYRRLDCGWVECGGIRLACTPEREQEVMRQVAWAKTFGLPLELLSPEQAQELFPLMVSDGVRCASYLPTDGYLDPSQLTYALVDGAREGGCRVFTHTRVSAIDVDGGRVRGVSTEWGDVEAEIVVNAGGMFAAELGRLAGVRVPVVPFAHEYLVTQPFRERGVGGDRVHLPTLRDPDLLVYFREEGGGLVMGGYERHSAPWSLDEHLLDRIPPDFNGRLLEEDWPRFEEIAGNSAAPDPGHGGRQGHPPDQWPGGVHARQRVLPRRDGGPRIVRGRRLLRPRPGRRRRDGQAGRRVDPRRRARERCVGDGHPPVRAAIPLPRLHAEASQGGVRDLLRHPLPRPRAGGREAAADLERLLLAPRPRRGVRREVGLGAGQLVRVQRGRRRSLPPAARLGGDALVAGDRRRAPRDPGGRGPVRRVVVREARGRRTRRRRAARAPVRQPRGERRRRDHLYPDAQRPGRDRVRFHGHPGGGGAVPDRHRHCVRQPRRELDPPPRARRTAR